MGRKTLTVECDALLSFTEDTAGRGVERASIEEGGRGGLQFVFAEN